MLNDTDFGAISIDIIAPEQWADIEGYEGVYQVSSWGRVKRLAGSALCIKDRFLSPMKDGRGLFVSLNKDNSHKVVRLKKLVYSTFVGPTNHHMVRVLDDDEENCFVDNLILTQPKATKGFWKLKDDDIRYIRRLREEGYSLGKVTEVLKDELDVTVDQSYISLVGRRLRRADVV